MYYGILKLKNQEVLCACSDVGLVYLGSVMETYEDMCRFLKRDDLVLNQEAISHVQVQMDQYFAGDLKAFDLPLDVMGTDFQKKVWLMLLQIPFGKSVSYSELAALLNTKAVRAVGSAVGKNPVMVVIPCHRVLSKGGGLGGFRGGLATKRMLLDLEGIQYSE